MKPTRTRESTLKEQFGLENHPVFHPNLGEADKGAWGRATKKPPYNKLIPDFHPNIEKADPCGWRVSPITYRSTRHQLIPVIDPGFWNSGMGFKWGIQGVTMFQLGLKRELIHHTLFHD